MKVKCCSVRLQGLIQISDKAYKAIDFNGNSDIIPASQVYGRDWDINKSEAYWISEWILKQKSITYTNKKIAWFDSESGKMLPTYIVEKHIPTKIEVKETAPAPELVK
jgi:hypothetical protein